MEFLLDVPLVVSLAEWVWGGDPDVSPDFCVKNLPFMNLECWSRLIVKGLGIAIILGSCLNKAPVMVNIMNAKSTRGLSSVAIYGETLVYANGALYGLLLGHPFTAYGENVALLLQSVVIIAMMWQFATPPKAALDRLMVALGFALYVAVTTMILPKDSHYLLMTSIMPVLLYSRGSQIIETLRCQHTGAQSIVTTTMSLVGVLIRILTTIKEVGLDMAVLGTYFLSCMLNLIMFVQYFYYRKNTEVFLADLKAKSQKKD
jgi:mannose-P-dolichol utilization defect protein 1